MNVAGIQDQYGSAGIGTLSTSWLMDTTPPTSKVSPLPAARHEPHVPRLGHRLGCAARHPRASRRMTSTHRPTAARGRSGPPSRHQTRRPAYTGQSNTTYAFYSIAHDLAGNTETKTPLIEASTYLPNLTPPVTSVNGTSGTNPSTVDPTTGTFTLNLTGNDPGGGVVTYFEVFASVDSGPYTPVNGTAIPAGPADSSGERPRDDPVPGPHRWRAITPMRSTASALTARATPSRHRSNPNLTLNETFAIATPSQLQVSSLVVENGAVERSYIRYLEIAFNESDSQWAASSRRSRNSVGTASPEIHGLQVRPERNGRRARRPSRSRASTSP